MSDYTNPIDIGFLTGSISGTSDGTPTWYRYDPIANGYLTLSVAGAGASAQVYVGEGSFASALEQPFIFFDYAAPADPWVAKFPATKAMLMRIGVIASGSFTLSWEQKQPTAALGLPALAPLALGALSWGFSVFVPGRGEVWTLLDSGSLPKVISRFSDSTGEFIGYIEHTVDLKDPIRFDIYNQKVWATVGAPNGTVWIDTNTLEIHDTPLPVIQSHDNFSPATGELWVEGPQGSLALKTIRHISQAGVMLSETGVPGFFDMLFTIDGNLWLNVGGQTATSWNALIKHFDVNTLAVTATYDLNTATTHAHRFVLDNNRNSLWVLAYVNPDGSEPYTSGYVANRLIEFSLSSRSVINSFGIPEVVVQNYDGHMRFDSQRDTIWLLDTNFPHFGDPVIRGFSTADGAETYNTGPLWYADDLAVGSLSLWTTGYGVLYHLPLSPPVTNPGPINDRDVWLESYAERFEKVTAQFGGDVINAQTNGVGITFAGAKRLDLSASVQFFIIKA